MRSDCIVKGYDKYEEKYFCNNYSSVKHIQIIGGYLDITYVDKEKHIQHGIYEIDDELEFYIC